MKRFICKLFGHQWRERGTQGTPATPFCVCMRCGEIGWWL